MSTPVKDILAEAQRQENACGVRPLFRFEPVGPDTFRQLLALGFIDQAGNLTEKGREARGEAALRSVRESGWLDDDEEG